MSSFVRLMSTEAVGVGEVAVGAGALQAAARSARTAMNRRARISSQDMGHGALVGGGDHLRRVLRLPLGRGCAETLVVDVLRDRRVLAADRALRVAPQPYLAE